MSAANQPPKQPFEKSQKKLAWKRRSPDGRDRTTSPLHPVPSHGGHRHVSFFLASGAPTAEFGAHLESDTVLVPVEQSVDALSVPAQRELVAGVMDDLRRLVEVNP